MTANLIQQQDMLKELSDQQLAQQMQYPSGDLPLFLVSTEAKRRADLRQRFKVAQAEPPEKTTVQEDLLRSILTGETPPTGIAQNLGQGPQTPPIQGRLPQIDPRQGVPQPQGGVPPTPGSPQPQMLAQAPVGIMQGSQPQGLPGNIQAPRGFAGGGQVRGFQEGGFAEQQRLLALHRRDAPEPVSRLPDEEKPWWMSSVKYDLARKRARDIELRNAPYYTEPSTPPIEWSISEHGATDLTKAGHLGEGVVDFSQPVAAPGVSTPVTDSVIRTPPSQMDLARQRLAGAKLSSLELGEPPAPTVDTTAWPVRKSAGAPPGPPGPGAYEQFIPKPVDPLELKSFPTRKEFETGADFNTARDARLAVLKAEGDPYEGQSEKLEEREARLEKDVKRDPWLALAEGGFKMAAGESQYAMQNIGEGGQAGLAALVASKKGREERGDKLFDARTGLTDKKQALLQQRKAEADQYGDRALAGQDRMNVLIARRNEYNKDDTLEENTQRRATWDVKIRTEDRRIAADLENKRMRLTKARDAAAFEARMYERKIRDLNIEYETATDARKAEIAAQIKSDEYQLRIYEMQAKRFADYEKMAHNEVLALMKETGATERTQITASKMPDAVKITKWMQNATPEEQATVKEILGGKNAGVTFRRNEGLFNKIKIKYGDAPGSKFTKVTKTQFVEEYRQQGGDMRLLPLFLGRLGANLPGPGTPVYGKDNLPGKNVQ